MDPILDTKTLKKKSKHELCAPQRENANIDTNSFASSPRIVSPSRWAAPSDAAAPLTGTQAVVVAPEVGTRLPYRTSTAELDGMLKELGMVRPRVSRSSDGSYVFADGSVHVRNQF